MVPRGRQLSHVAIGSQSRVHANHLGAAQARKARQRRHRGRWNAVKGHEDRLTGSEIHVGQQVEQPTLAQVGNDGLDPVCAVEHAHVAKTLAARHEPGVNDRVGMGRKNGRERPGRAQRQYQPASVQPVEMGSEDDGGHIAVQFMHSALELHALLHHRLRGGPQPAAVQPGLAKDDKALARPLRALLNRCLRKAQLKITQSNLAPWHHEHKQHPPQRGPHGAQHWQRHSGQHAHEPHTQPTHHDEASTAGASARGCL